MRFTAAGTLDTTYGSGGKVVNIPGVGPMGALTPQDNREDIALDPGTNKVVLSANQAGGTVVARFNTNGSLDSSFGTGGTVTLPALRYSSSVAIQADYKVVLAGTVDSGGTTELDFGVARLDGNGSADNSFGIGGLVVTPTEFQNDVASSVAIQANGQILVFGCRGTGDPTFAGDPVLARDNPTDGSLDTTFGDNGLAIPLGIGPMFCADMALAPDGRIVVAGGNNVNPVRSIVARFLATGPTIGSFASDAAAVAARYPVTLSTAEVSVMPWGVRSSGGFIPCVGDRSGPAGVPRVE